MPLILGTNSIKDTGYDVANSLRFNSGSSDRLTRSFSAGSSSLWTWSGWIKRSKLGSRQSIFTAYSSSSNVTRMEFTANDELKFNDENGGNTNGRIVSTARYRDPSAWMHIVFHWDSSDSTSADRLRMYVNNVRVTDFSDTGNAPSTTSRLNTAMTHEIGSENNGTFFEGYMAEVVFINGANLDPDQFGEYDEDSPTIWKPKDVSGLTFGTTGFYLDFEDSSALGNDVSGNNNDWSVSNLTAIDQTTDTCTNNFAVINPLSIHPSSTFTITEGNLQFATSSSTRGYWISTFGVSSGKWYWEYKVTNNQARTDVGIAGAPAAGNNDPESTGTHDNVTVYLTINGQVSINSGGSTDNFYNQATSSNDIIIGTALDLDSSPNTIAFSIDGEWVTGSGTKSTTFSSATKINSFTNVASTVNGVYHFIAGDDGGEQDIGGQANFGNPPFSISSGNSDANSYGNFEYPVPSGYFALNTKNLAEYG